MYRCEECGKLFHIPIRVRVTSMEAWGRKEWETAAACPFCRSLNIKFEEKEQNDGK